MRWNKWNIKRRWKEITPFYNSNNCENESNQCTSIFTTPNFDKSNNEILDMNFPTHQLYWPGYWLIELPEGWK